MSQQAPTQSNQSSNASQAGSSAKPETSGATRSGVQMKQSLRGVPMDVQMKMLAPSVQMKGGAPDTAGVHQAAAEGIQGGGGAMPHGSAIQKAFGGHDISGLKGHTGGAAAQANAKMGAEAYASGDHVAFKGAPDLHTAAHEAAHHIQQKQGVSLAGGVGQTGDAYEQHADKVADAVVKGESAEGLLSSGAKGGGGGGGAGVQKKAIQFEKAATLKTSNAQTTAATDNKVPEDAKKKVDGNSAKSPTSHPMYATFSARVQSLFAQYPPPPGYDIALLTRNIWTQICGGIEATQPEMERKAGNTTYSNPDRGWVDMESAGFKKAMHEFDSVMATLKTVNASQFAKAKTFGFWSKPEGRKLAEQMSDLTLETSGIGALFDDIPSLNAHQNGWDPQLWGALSNAFGEACAVEMQKKGKSVHVFAGGGTDKKNVFGAVESKALAKGASAMGKTLEEAVTFHAVAANSKSNRTPNTGIQEGDLPGTWYSGHSWDDALKVGGEKFAKLPA